MAHSREIWNTLKDEDWMKEWLAVQGNQVHLAETRRGVIQNIETVN